MRIFKAFLSLSIIFLFLSVIILLAYHIFSINLFKNSSKNTQNQDIKKEVSDGIILNLEKSNINGSMFVFLNGEAGARIVKYSFFDQSVDTVLDLKDLPFEYYVPGKILIEDESQDVFYLQDFGDDSVIYKYKFSNSDQSEEILTIQGYNLVGQFKVGNFLFVTAFKKQEDIYVFSIIKINLTDKSSSFVISDQSTSSSLIPVVVNIKEDKLFFKGYNISTNSLDSVCFDSELINISCTEAFDLDVIVDYRKPDEDSGFKLGQEGFLKLLYKDQTEKNILTGIEDEQFQSPYLFDDSIFFISGQIISDLGNSESFGSFVPSSLEEVNLSDLKRNLLVTLPSSSVSNIEFVNDDIIILEISLKGSNKFDVKPGNLWYFNRKTQKLKQISEIDCDEQNLCEVKFLQFF